jgi:hypothetical protein
VSSSPPPVYPAASPVYPAPPELNEAEAPVEVKYDISYESSFFQHYFETGVEKEKVFSPTYRCVVETRRKESFSIFTNYFCKELQTPLSHIPFPSHQVFILFYVNRFFAFLC